MNHARNAVLFLWLALAAAWIRTIGLSDGVAAVFGSLFLLFLGLVLVGLSVLYLILRRWLKVKTAVEPSPRFLKGRRILRFIPVIPTILFFVFSYSMEYGDYVLMFRDMEPSRTEQVMDALGSTLNITFICYAIIELFLLSILWKKNKDQRLHYDRDGNSVRS